MAIGYGFLSTHPPTMCGLATFNSALATHLATHGTPSGIVRVTEAGDDQRPGPGVVQTWRATTTAGWRDAVAALNAYDVAVVQHEYGIYPGKDGEDVLPLLRRLTTPSIVVLHTVLSNPTAEQKSLLEQIVAAADAVVTMTDTAHDRLLLGYRVDARKVSVIPHGATDRPAQTPAPARQPGSHLLTWGLLGPGKGVEWVLRALTELRDLDPAPTYTVAGRTHPKVVARDGEAYRTQLNQLGARLGVAHMVNYRSGYQDPAELDRLIRSADVVVLPYDSREQVTSGVLTEAVAAGIPVVATAFPHAVEVLADGPGLLVPHGDPVALAGAVRRLLTEPGLSARLTTRTGPLTTDVRWPAVAARYDELAGRLIRAEATSADAATT
jgi:glycosyltransferase involved in cell wall biosynthesis